MSIFILLLYLAVVCVTLSLEIIYKTKYYGFLSFLVHYTIY